MSAGHLYTADLPIFAEPVQKV